MPNYTGAAPESSYFAGGQGALFAPATGKISNCATGPQGATPYAQQDCDAVNFLARNPSVRPQIAVGKNDPLVTGAKSILANPQALAGSMTGAYSACSTATVNQPATYDTEVCNQYTNMTQSTCQKVLTVTVQQVSLPPNCTVGTWQWTGLFSYWNSLQGGGNLPVMYYCDPNNSTTIQIAQRNVVVPGGYICFCSESGPVSLPTNGTPAYLHGGAQQYTATCTGNLCSITQKTLSGTAGYYQADGTRTIGRPGNSSTTTFTKSWDNQCAALEAQAQ